MVVGKVGIVDDEFCCVVWDLVCGQGVDFGGNVWKKCFGGNWQCGIVLGKVGYMWVFVFLFVKCDCENIDVCELFVFRKFVVDVG